MSLLSPLSLILCPRVLAPVGDCGASRVDKRQRGPRLGLRPVVNGRHAAASRDRDCHECPRCPHPLYLPVPTSPALGPRWRAINVPLAVAKQGPQRTLQVNPTSSSEHTIRTGSLNLWLGYCPTYRCRPPVGRRFDLDRRPSTSTRCVGRACTESVPGVPGPLPNRENTDDERGHESGTGVPGVPALSNSLSPCPASKSGCNTAGRSGLTQSVTAALLPLTTGQWRVARVPGCC